MKDSEENWIKTAIYANYNIKSKLGTWLKI